MAKIGNAPEKDAFGITVYGSRYPPDSSGTTARQFVRHIGANEVDIEDSFQPGLHITHRRPLTCGPRRREWARETRHAAQRPLVMVLILILGLGLLCALTWLVAGLRFHGIPD